MPRRVRHLVSLAADALPWLPLYVARTMTRSQVSGHAGDVIEVGRRRHTLPSFFDAMPYMRPEQSPQLYLAVDLALAVVHAAVLAWLVNRLLLKWSDERGQCAKNVSFETCDRATRVRESSRTRAGERRCVRAIARRAIMRVMLRSPSLGLLLLSGCLIANPAYDSDATGGSVGTTTTTMTATTEPVDPTTSSTGASVCRSHAECANDLFCDGDEQCDPAAAGADARGCVGGPAPCDVATCSEDQDACLAGCELDADADDDGADAIACGGLDCDDGDPDIHPGADEICDPDGVDEDCDPATLGGLDADGDGMISSECCNLDGGALDCGDDCDDGLGGVGVGDWAHCSACGSGCGDQQACADGECISARRVFVTSTTHNAKLGGVAGADAICQARADEAALGGTFKAYIVQPGAGLDRLAHPDVPFVRLDGVQVADNWNDLADENLDAPIDHDEYRQPHDYNAWTGLRDVDGGGVSSCNSWTSDDGDCINSQICGGGGEITMTGDHWDGFYIFNCNQMFRLYCIEQ